MKSDVLPVSTSSQPLTFMPRMTKLSALRLRLDIDTLAPAAGLNSMSGAGRPRAGMDWPA